MQRKTQLDAMLGDSQRYEAKRQEVDAWLTRMETRMDRMGTVGHTADVLEAQLREQKVRLRIACLICVVFLRTEEKNWTFGKIIFFFQSFHAELHQYKYQVELFNSLTQKLIAVYQQDDTTRVKKMTETINQRYNNLNTRWVVYHKTRVKKIKSKNDTREFSFDADVLSALGSTSNRRGITRLLLPSC